ncbi:MAG: acyltransferase [Bacteroidetes bacterium]|nr:acyltransferase [Bacteroidota bacterium]
MTTDRRHDIDWLRVIAIGLLIIYHIGIAFQPWGVLIGFIQSTQSLKYLWPPMSMLNVWRIPLLFFVSGMGVSFAIRKRNWKQLLLERSKRILVPFLFGMVVIVPLHLLLWQKYYSQDLKFTPHPGHLWFLANIFIYVLLLSPLFFYLKRKENGRWIRGLFSNPLGLLFVAACFVLETILVRPESFSMYAYTFHGFLLGLLAFLFGFCFILAGEAFWLTLRKWRWLLLLAAVALFLVRYLVFKLEAPNYFIAIESCSWIFAVLGFANKYLNRPGKTLGYLSQAAYPVYILHMIFLYLGSSLLFPLEISTLLKFILVILFTIAGCFLFYEIIKRVKFIRPLFGLKG